MGPSTQKAPGSWQGAQASSPKQDLKGPWKLREQPHLQDKWDSTKGPEGGQYHDETLGQE